ncbi:hypothetical protein FRC12_005755 [Ceratobasidium sp. 428]|nr:hypothetical protein FRC12_005755 [Ceratobasidium sp. 428]
MREIILLSLKFEIKHEQIDQLEQMVQRWVLEYEQYYYQYQDRRLPTCPLTIHGLLHIAHYIRQTGPPWASWAFVMERICGHIVLAVKSRVRPYDNLDNYIERRGQMQIVSHVYNFPSLSKPRVNWNFEYGEQISSREVIYPNFPTFALGVPIQRRVPLEQPLARHFTRYFGPFNRGQTAAQIAARIEANSITRYGRVRLTGDGDRIRTAALIDNDPIARDNSFIKYDLVPDDNASDFSGSDHPYLEAQYARLLDIYHLWFNHTNGTREEYLLGRVQVCETGGLDAGLPENPYVTFKMDDMLRLSPQIINMKTVVVAVGRVHITGHEWAIVDRSRDNACTQFLDEEGNVEFEHQPE